MAGYLRQILPDPPALSARAAELFVIAASSAISGRGVFNVAFSGGTTPALMLSMLAQPPYKEGVDWDKVHVFFVDERCVPPDNEQSNFRLADDALLSKVNASVHRIHGELAPEEASGRYEKELRDTLGAEAVLDMVFLGMGADGHTASLFPGSGALEEEARLAVAVTDQAPPRVSITLPVINAARTAVFHVTGEQKAGPVREVLEGSNPRGLPAGLVSKRALWLLDEAAAAELPEQSWQA